MLSECISHCNGFPFRNIIRHVCTDNQKASVDIQFLRNKVDKEGNLHVEEEISHALETSLQVMIREIQEKCIQNTDNGK
ncbi:MAG: hypothetical protein IPL26_08540 [Leptospiraceae bacterium]|nr:hypothetical protein [Leptospiraceae bacterium]